VTQTHNSAGDSRFGSTAGRLGWIILIAATLYVSYFANLGIVGLVGPDEPRYAWIARNMTESGDWVTPRLYGKTWFEKPVLYYWSAALSFKALGVSDTAARLPSAVAALIATLGLAWLAWRIYGTETARWLLLFLPSMVGMIGFSHAAATDMPFAASLTMALIVQMRLLDRTVSTSSARIVNSTAMAACVFGFFAQAAGAMRSGVCIPLPLWLSAPPLYLGTFYAHAAIPISFMYSSLSTISNGFSLRNFSMCNRSGSTFRCFLSPFYRGRWFCSGRSL